MPKNTLDNNVELVMQSTVARTSRYFETEFGISVTEVDIIEFMHNSAS